MRKVFFFGGESSDAYGITIASPPDIPGAERSITEQNVPGRNGALLIDDGYYKNTTVTYKDTWIKFPRDESAANYARRLKGWLLSAPGEYRQLYDSYDGDYCRYAYFSGSLDSTVATRGIIQQDLQFACKPFQYLRSGLNLREVNSGDSLINPHRFPTSPYIKITGSGDVTLSVGNSSWTFSGITDYIEIDSERMATYKGTLLQNQRKHGDGYPQLDIGNTGISWSGGTVQKVEIIPRWRTL